ncbi:glycosyltransferase [Algoriphagus hitonicola]|uniref:Glycosyltransferase involved in cell wall bisynthesis n=1 Tax=Algoriphagus hitonicola TaxID=435880 RepID=A0A1I2TJ95_9BACT|nr:glycosyltransferase [Algoriphagus hitonicola]SFG64189.1 Glycosyltransferase involved in cell wall bisynthesis [Algoriphagus hitonicola]
MIRILHCIETIASGGVEQVRLTLIRGLPKDRFEHKIICTWKGGAIAEALEAAGVELIPIGGFKNPLEWRKHKKVLEVIREFKPQIIHGAIFEGMAMAAVGGTLGKVPVVILEETSHPIHRSKKAIYLQRLFAKAADKVIGIAPTVVTYLKDTIKLPASKVVLINNGVNQPREVNSEEIAQLKNVLGIQPGELVIGSSGRFYNEVKRFTDILDAISTLDNPNLKFLLLGQGQDQDLILNHAKKLNLERHLIMPGFQSDTAPYYQIMDMFCIASAHEGFGLVAAEAMLHQLPVLATKVGGLQDIVVNGETGFLVDVYSPDQIAEKIKILIQNPDLRKTMGQNGYQRAMDNYTAVRYCEEVERLYLELLEGKGYRNLSGDV